MTGEGCMDPLMDLFDDFYREVNHGAVPYEWQRRLVSYVARDGIWPKLLDGPTGSGKSAVIEAHIFLNAIAGEMGVPISTPRRMAIAVNRRSLVDSQYLHAKEIAERLRLAYCDEESEEAHSPILKRIASGLAKRWGESGRNAPKSMGPLLCTSMRGGLDDRHPDITWRIYPEAPMIICATPDMVGSRLLFRGYGVSKSMRPVEAALLSCDCVLVIDEAHLNRQLVKTARRISVLETKPEVCRMSKPTPETSDDAIEPDGLEKWPPLGAVANPLQVMESTATPVVRDDLLDESAKVEVTQEDLSTDDVLAARVTRPKIISLHDAERGKAYTGEIVQLALEAHAEHGGITAVIVNTVQTAISVDKGLKEAGSDVDSIICILGRMRQSDRQAEVEKLLDLSRGNRSAFIVGTQALEVGLNYDCKSMVTEICPVSALIQRLGRVNRFGRYDNAHVTVVDGGGASAGPYDQEELDDSRTWITELVQNKPDGVSAFELSKMKTGIPIQRGNRVLFQRLEEEDVNYLSHTSEHLSAENGVQTIDGDETDLALWLRDQLGDDGSRDVSLIVRDGLPANAAAAAGILSRIPPLEREMFPCSYSEIRGVMDVCFGAETKSTDGAETHPLYVSEDGQRFRKIDQPTKPIPGGVYVIDSQTPVFCGPIVAQRKIKGKLDCASDVHDDIALENGVADIPFMLTDRTIERACSSDDESLGYFRELISGLREDAAALMEDPDSEQSLDDVMDAFIERVRQQFGNESALAKIADNLEAIVVPNADDASGDQVSGDNQIVLVYRPNINSSDVSRLEIGGMREIGLDEHQSAVSNCASQIARSVGLNDLYVNALELAGKHHDDGKAACRFQQMLGGGKQPSRLLAKGKNRSRSEVLSLYRALNINGWRHEQLSAAIAWDEMSNEDIPAGERELITRLVGTTHGRGRSSFDQGPVDLCADADKEVDAPHEEAVDALYGTGLWESLVATTDHMYGYWGSSYLEAILRAADSRVSASEQVIQGDDQA